MESAKIKINDLGAVHTRDLNHERIKNEIVRDSGRAGTTI